MAKLHGRGINIKIQTYLHQFPKESKQINSYLRTYYIYIIYLIQPQNLNTSRHNILQDLGYEYIFGESTLLCHE